jgi:hypothetical protein
MFRVSMAIAVMTVGLLSQQPPAAQATSTPVKTPEPGASAYKTVMDRLYRLIWPLGQSKLDIASAVSSGTEKSAPVGDVARLYLVNATTGAVREWPSAAGAVQTVVCPDARVLFFHRGNGLFKEIIRATAQDVSAVSDPVRFPDLVITRLYACTQDQNGGFALWAEDQQGKLSILRVRGKSAAWEDLPRDHDLSAIEPQELAEDLQRIRCIRPDGFVVWIQNHQLLGRRDPKADASLLVNSELSFSGFPSWIGESGFLFATANSTE